MKEIVMRYQNGELAFTDIIPHFEKMIYSMIHRRFATVSGCEFSDLYNAGLMGLFQACEQYDVSRGVEASTFLYWKVMGEITARRRESECMGWREQQESVEETMETIGANEVKTRLSSPATFERDLMIRNTVDSFLSDDMDRRIYHLKARGHTQSEISAKVGIAQQNVGRRLRKLLPALETHLISEGYLA